MTPFTTRSSRLPTLLFVAGLSLAGPALAQGRAAADVCVAIDDGHDTLAPADRTAALLLISREFESAGWHVVLDGCANEYRLSHVALGTTISVTIIGSAGRRDGIARGLDDLPALYNQMVRSIVTGRPMQGMNVVDRTNVTRAQAEAPQRVASDSFGYVRLGAGNLGAGLGLGHRVERDAVAIDVSFLNFSQRVGASSSIHGSKESGMWTWFKMEGLHFADTKADRSAYVGGGLSFGGGYFSDGTSWVSWSGYGLQGELTGGWEFGRASTLRFFVQADATLPFYHLVARGESSRYMPSIMVSVGVGWQHARR